MDIFIFCLEEGNTTSSSLVHQGNSGFEIMSEATSVH